VPANDGWVPTDKPQLLRKFGADAQAGFPTPKSASHRFPEAFKRDGYRATLAMAARAPTLAGMSP
jgi:beta-glucuronidase